MNGGIVTQGRHEFLFDLIEVVDEMADGIAEREVLEPDLAIVRELAEQLREELHSLKD